MYTYAKAEFAIVFAVLISECRQYLHNAISDPYS